MAGVGINSHVETEEIGSDIRLSAQSVPLAETPRLEAREFEDADPTFAALASDLFRCLIPSRASMDAYDAKQWHAKINSLAGLERSERRESRQEFLMKLNASGGAFKSERSRLSPRSSIVLLMNKAMLLANSTHQRWRLFQIAIHRVIATRTRFTRTSITSNRS